MDPITALPPGFVIDTPPAANGLPPGFVIDTPAVAQPDIVPGGNGEPTRITVRPEAPQAPMLQRVQEAINPANVISNVGSTIVNGGHSLAVGAQGVGAGVRDVALLFPDLAAGAQNLVMGGINKVFGTEIPMATPASQLADKVTAPFAIPETEMAPNERLGYNISRYGTQGLGMGSMLAARAPAVAEAAAPAANFVGRTLDTLARPYTAAPAKTVLGDTVSGMGSGAAVNAAHEYLPQEPVTPAGKFMKGAADFLAPLAGGVGASTLQGAAEGVGGLIRNLFNRRVDANIPKNPNTGAAYNHADSNRAAAALQKQTTGAPNAIGRDIRENAAELTNPTRPGEVPVEPSQVPTSGLLSRDPGMVRAETGARTKDNGAFVQRDQNVKEAAAQRVDSLRDSSADQNAVGKFMQDEPKRLAAERDAEAIPLLKQAEQSGAAVDTSTVARMIDEKLATAKRPPVRAALTEAKKHLNKVGTEELDTSVSGVYEARKALNDIIEGRGENATGRFAKRELLEVRKELDTALTKASPEFGQYLQKYREGSEPIDAFTESPAVQAVVNSKNGDVRNTVKSIMTNGAYGGERQAEEIGKLIAQNPEAKDGFRAAVGDVLSDKITNSKKTGETYEVAYARLAKEFKNNEALLTKVYSPEEMNTLRQGHKLLEYFKEAEKRPTSGSPTAERFEIPPVVQLGIRHFWGEIKGGGIVKRLKLMIELLPSNRQNAQEIADMAWFNPNVAAYLLEKKVADPNVYINNVGVRRLIATDNAARESGGN